MWTWLRVALVIERNPSGARWTDGPPARRSIQVKDPAFFNVTTPSPERLSGVDFSGVSLPPDGSGPSTLHLLLMVAAIQGWIPKRLTLCSRCRRIATAGEGDERPL